MKTGTGDIPKELVSLTMAALEMGKKTPVLLL